MDTTFPAATFTATRDELLGAEPLLASAEIARGICRAADRTVGVLAITPVRMRRIDGWLGAAGFVTHAAASDPGRPSLGALCDRDRSPALLREIVGSLVGEVAVRPAHASVELPSLRGLSPASLPVAVDWVVVVSSASGPNPATRWIIAAADGLLAGDVHDLDRSVRLDPAEPAHLDARFTELAGVACRSIRDLLRGD
jgi:hypothetical protein